MVLLKLPELASGLIGGISAGGFSQVGRGLASAKRMLGKKEKSGGKIEQN